MLLGAALSSAIGSLGLVSGGPAVAGVTTSSFNGVSTTAWFFPPQDGCYARAGFVEARDSRGREEDGGPSRNLKVRIALTESDACNGPGSYDPPISNDVSIDGEAELAPEDFKVRGDLGMASLRATVALRPYGSDHTVPIKLDLSWRAVDDAFGPRYRFMFRDPDGNIVIYRFMSLSRRAVASGTILDVSGAVSMTSIPMIDYGGTTNSGYISSGKTGDVVIRK
jgi:hypothetical protein